MFIVASGEVTILKKGELGESVEIGALRAGDFGGMMSLFDTETRSATLVARTTTELWILDSATFHQLLTSSQEFSMSMYAFMSRRMRQDTQILTKLNSLRDDSRPTVAVFDSK